MATVTRTETVTLVLAADEAETLADYLGGANGTLGVILDALQDALAPF